MYDRLDFGLRRLMGGSTLGTFGKTLLEMSKIIMRFRHARKSNDIYSWVSLVLCFCGVVVFFITFFHSEPALPRAFSILGLSLFLIAFFYCSRFCAKPIEWELVVEGDLIRWGRADCPQAQQKLDIKTLVCLIYDKSDNQVLGDIGRLIPIKIGAGILIQLADQEAFVANLRQNYPSLMIKVT